MTQESLNQEDAVVQVDGEEGVSLPDPRREAEDDLLVLALAEGLTQGAAGERVGVCDRTVRRRLQNPEFVGRVRERRRQMVEEGTGRVTSRFGDAVDALGELLSSPDPGIRLRAAMAIIRTTSDYQTNADLAARIEDLEAVAVEEEDE